jgi:hypothetical protein
MIRVTFHTFRYFYRAIECHRAKDILLFNKYAVTIAF